MPVGDTADATSAMPVATGIDPLDTSMSRRIDPGRDTQILGNRRRSRTTPVAISGDRLQLAGIGNPRAVPAVIAANT